MNIFILKPTDIQRISIKFIDRDIRLMHYLLLRSNVKCELELQRSDAKERCKG